MIELSPDDRAMLAAARTATLATIDPDGLPRLVPVCFVVETDAARLWIPIDEKPKRAADPRDLARIRDITARPDVALLVDRWSEDWADLAWLRLDGRATLVEPADATGGLIDHLRTKYPQYRDHDLETRPLLRVDLARATRWSARG